MGGRGSPSPADAARERRSGPPAHPPGFVTRSCFTKAQQYPGQGWKGGCSGGGLGGRLGLMLPPFLLPWAELPAHPLLLPPTGASIGAAPAPICGDPPYPVPQKNPPSPHYAQLCLEPLLGAHSSQDDPPFLWPGAHWASQPSHLSPQKPGSPG